MVLHYTSYQFLASVAIVIQIGWIPYITKRVLLLMQFVFLLFGFLEALKKDNF